MHDDHDEKMVAFPDIRISQETFKCRFIYLFGPINQESARRVCEILVAMDHASSDPIRMLVSSPGGHVESGDAIHDMIRFVNSEVIMIGSGWVASAGTHVFLAAKKENRYCLPNTRFMIHQPSGGAGGPVSDITIQAKEVLRTRERIARAIADSTGQPLDKVLTDIDRDFWMSPEEAINYGIVSKVIRSKSELS